MEIELDELEGVLVGFANALAEDPFTEALQECKVPIAQNFVSIFASQMDSGGNAWPEHAPFTVKMHGVHPLLILTGAMYASVTQEGSEGNLVFTNDRSLSWGTGITYASKNNFGGFNQTGSYVPAREFVYWTQDAANACVNIVDQHLDSLIGRVLA